MRDDLTHPAEEVVGRIHRGDFDHCLEGLREAEMKGAKRSGLLSIIDNRIANRTGPSLGLLVEQATTRGWQICRAKGLNLRYDVIDSESGRLLFGRGSISQIYKWLQIGAPHQEKDMLIEAHQGQVHVRNAGTYRGDPPPLSDEQVAKADAVARVLLDAKPGELVVYTESGTHVYRRKRAQEARIV